MRCPLPPAVLLRMPSTSVVVPSLTALSANNRPQALGSGGTQQTRTTCGDGATVPPVGTPTTVTRCALAFANRFASTSPDSTWGQVRLVELGQPLRHREIRPRFPMSRSIFSTLSRTSTSSRIADCLSSGALPARDPDRGIRPVARERPGHRIHFGGLRADRHHPALR